MRIVFFGTPYYVLPILELLHKEFKVPGEMSPIAAVVTQSPKPVGRNKVMQYSPIDNWAHKKAVPIFFDSKDLIKEKIKADIGILASYGAMIPKEVINYFELGILVVHPSLLPEFRWGSPVPAAITTGLSTTGVTIIKMDEEWDHGPILTALKDEVLPTDTYGSLRDRLFLKSGELLVQMIPAYLKGKIKLKDQDEKKATYARIINKDDAFIPGEYIKTAIEGRTKNDIWKIGFIKDYATEPTPEAIERFIRAMDPWPQAWTNVKLNSKLKTEDSKKMKLLKAHLEPFDNKELSVISYKLQLDIVQLEGKNPVAWEQFKSGYPEAKFN